MSPPSTSRLVIGISSRALASISGGVGQRPQQWLMPSEGLDPAPGASTVPPDAHLTQTVRDALRRASLVNVVFGSSLARHWVQSAPGGLRSLAELRAWVQARAGQLFGTPSDWIVAADWRADRPFLCAALPAPWVDRLRAWAGAGGAGQRTPRLRFDTTLLRQIAQGRLAQQGWQAFAEPGWLTLLHLSDGLPDHLHSVALPVPATLVHPPVADGSTALGWRSAQQAELARAAALTGWPASPLVEAADPSQLALDEAGFACTLDARQAGLVQGEVAA